MVSNQVRSGNSQINLSGSSGGWEVRNVGWRGRRSSHTPCLAVACRNPNQTGIIEGCYFGDGGTGEGIWVHPKHAGEIIIRNCYFEGFGDNALYASAPGNHSNHPVPGAGGVVKVENCYSTDSAISNFRLGTDGSYLKNCVSTNPRHGAFWGFYNRTKLINCDISGPIRLSDKRWSDSAVVELENTRWNGSPHQHYGGARIVGGSAGNARDYYPGVPLSPAAARDGNLTGDPGSGGSGGSSLADILNDGENEIVVRPE